VGDGTFTPLLVLDPGVFPLSLDLADLDGDTNLDIVVAGGLGVAVALGTGSGFGFFGPIAAATASSHVVVADVDGDQVPDVLATDDHGLVRILRGRGDGTFVFAGTFPVGGTTALAGTEPVAVGDLDGDGWPDLVSADALADALNVMLSLRPGSPPAPSSSVPAVPPIAWLALTVALAGAGVRCLRG